MNRIRCLVIACLIAIGATRARADNTIIFPGDGFVGDGTRYVHDPTIIQFNGTYFCFCTAGNQFGVLRSSTDLIHWKIIGPILPQRPAWLEEKLPGHRSLWAPDILRTGDRLRMYYCCSEKFGQNTSYIGVAQRDHFDPTHPLEGWHDLGLVIESHEGHDNFNAIDPETIRDDAGHEWMFFGSYWNGIYVTELDPASGRLKDAAHPQMTLVARNPADLHNALEAPAVIHHDGYYYLFCSYGLAAQGVKSTYRVGVGRSKSITGPYVDLTGKPMLDGGRTMMLNTSPPMFGPGHCDVFTDGAGRMLLAHHMYDGRERWHGDVFGLPTLQVRDLLWDTHGWPLPGLPIGFQIDTPHDAMAGTWIQQTDFGTPIEIVFQDDATFTSASGNGTWTATAQKLSMKWTDDTSIDFVLNTDRNFYVGHDAKGLLIRAARKFGGS